MLADAPSFASIADSFNRYIKGCNVVGHNFVDFDYKFLYANGIDFESKTRFYDTLNLAKLVLTKTGAKVYDNDSGTYDTLSSYEADVDNYKLSTICEYYDICRDDAHRSLSDSYATAKIFKNLVMDKIST